MGAKCRDCRLLFTPLSLILVLSCSKYGYAIENITRSQQLFQEKTLISPGQVFELGFFSPDNSGTYQYVGIWYKGMSPQTVVWVANRENPLRVADPSTSLNIGDNGNLELVDGNQTSVWSTNVRVPSNSSVATLLDNGNLVLKDGELGEILWQSFDHPGDTFLPSSVIGYNAKTGQSFVLTSWKSKGDPSRGSFTVGISPKMKPAQAINWNGTTPQWRTGPWSKLKFIGVPEMDDSYESQFGLAEDWERGTTYLYFNSIVSMYSHTLLSSDGTLKYMVKENGSDWRMVWRFPKNLCDVYGVCGPSGVCKASETPVCSCLTGFVPKSDLEWSEQNWTQGCLRRTKLSCEQNSSSPNSKGQKKDLFVQFHNMKLPDFYEYVSSRKNINSCQTWCLDNCSCRAYAYVNGIGCLIWSEYLVDIQEFSYGGEDLFLRLSHRELGGQKNKMIIISLTIVSCVVTFTMLLLITLHRWRGNQKRNVEETKEKSHSIKAGKNLGSAFQFAEQHDVPEFPIFDFHSISVATDHFSIENKLGQGGFGPVYKGKLQDGTEIAVKRLSSSSGQGMQEFKNEMILISKLQHRNLVRLVGCCIDREERLLIYELMPNRSLDNFIVDPKRRVQLNWTMRFNIINGIARGLLYLHRDSCFKVIHRDLKISNILLDENMNPKISDFGLARIFQGTLDLANTNRVVGTFGYMSPEYAMGGIFSEKSDVFSFGVLILEIVGGRKNTSFQYYENHLSLIAYAWHLWSEGRGIDMVDNALEGSYSSVEAMRCIHVGLLCVQDHAVDRPTMPDIVSMLRNEMGLSHPKEPLFTFQRSLELQQQSDSRCSANEVTMSSIQGR